MKFVLFTAWFLGLTFFVSAADSSKPAPTRIDAVVIDADKHTLVIRYSVADKPVEARLVLAHDIADFRYCRWMGNRGIAIVARTGDDDASEYFYSAFPLSGEPAKHTPSKIPAPKGNNPVLGIGNTGGDSIVVTAVQHRRDPSESISGWTYIDNCPITDLDGVALGHVTPFSISAERAKPK